MLSEFLCPNCDTLLEVDDPHVGMTVECPICFRLGTVTSLTPPELEVAEEGTLPPDPRASRQKDKRTPLRVPDAAASSDSGNYLCVPFDGFTRSSDPSPARTLAAQLQKTLNDYEKQGWVFQRIDTVRVFLNPGCLASIFGAQVQAREYDIVIFKRKL